MMSSSSQADSTIRTGMRPIRRLPVAVAAGTTVIRRLPPIEVVFTLALILAANVAVGIAAVRGDAAGDTLRSFIRTLGDLYRVALDVFLVALGLTGVLAVLCAGFVLPDLLAERERVRREEPTPRAVEPEPVASHASPRHAA
jgi:hypothetical protein